MILNEHDRYLKLQKNIFKTFLMAMKFKGSKDMTKKRPNYFKENSLTQIEINGRFIDRLEDFKILTDISKLGAFLSGNETLLT